MKRLFFNIGLSLTVASALPAQVPPLLNSPRCLPACGPGFTSTKQLTADRWRVDSPALLSSHDGSGSTGGELIPAASIGPSFLIWGGTGRAALLDDT